MVQAGNYTARIIPWFNLYMTGFSALCITFYLQFSVLFRILSAMNFNWKSLFKRYRIINKPKVYALVGRSGSGKSFRSKLIADKYHIDLILDDGLLIQQNRIVAGMSAKREKNRFRAVKRAIFEDKEHRKEIRKCLSSRVFNSILILGISDRMIGRIIERLGLPFPDQVIRIEDVATEEEIAMARNSRITRGRHVIPVPVIEVKTDPAHHVVDSIRLFIRNHPVFFWKKQTVEKTIVEPPFSKKGRLRITENALSQMIMHCIEEFDAEINVQKIIIDEIHDYLKIEVCLKFPFGKCIPDDLANLQTYILDSIEKFSGILLDAADLTVECIEN